MHENKKEGVAVNEVLTLTKSTHESGLLIKYGAGYFYIDVRRSEKGSYLVGGWLISEDVDPKWGSGSHNHNLLMEAYAERLPIHAAKILEPLAGERNIINTQEELRDLIQKIGENAVIKAIYEAIKDREAPCQE